MVLTDRPAQALSNDPARTERQTMRRREAGRTVQQNAEKQMSMSAVCGVTKELGVYVQRAANDASL